MLTNPVELCEKISKLIGNFASAELMNDNFYAFSYNNSLINTDIQEIKKMPNIRMKYIQVDSMNKCVPQDWFLGYDAFAIYSFLNLAGQ